MRTFSITGVMQQKATTLLVEAKCSRNNTPLLVALLSKLLQGCTDRQLHMLRHSAAHSSSESKERMDGKRRTGAAIVKKPHQAKEAAMTTKTASAMTGIKRLTGKTHKGTQLAPICTRHIRAPNLSASGRRGDRNQRVHSKKHRSLECREAAGPWRTHGFNSARPFQSGARLQWAGVPANKKALLVMLAAATQPLAG